MGYGARKMERPATLADIDALPEGVVGKIIDGTLYTHARPVPGHGFFQSELMGALRGPFQHGGPRRSRPSS